MTDTRICSLLEAHPIFRGCDPALLGEALAGGQFRIVSFEKGETVYSPESPRPHRLGVMLEGSAGVYSADEGRQVFLRTLTVSDSFGVSNLFTEDPFVSRIVAATRATILFIEAKDMELLLERDRVMRGNYIRFLSERIVFLNQRITYFTAGSAERRLALYLAANAKDGRVEISMNRLAKTLDIGRASLYRAMETLIADALIEKDGKHIVILAPDQMTQHYKS